MQKIEEYIRLLLSNMLICQTILELEHHNSILKTQKQLFFLKIHKKCPNSTSFFYFLQHFHYTSGLLLFKEAPNGKRILRTPAEVHTHS